ncbi:hypothetical protein [Mycolicibacterium aichiense]|uniref:hypothetical protein n=2 Tax=Mycolicibacterium aichiense TaxID=1799 RepID=UPI000E07DCEC|nr:hypothetical protein [Mycolicibacterium aichiense]MCV7018443.1 hypothetical protein [Mycolicibacterium aichiense]STZ81013.1 Uncharacterised protein [Mycolicibacterium aichiense]
MYMSAERFALANQAVRDTFAQCSIVWQAIPHWDVGDPGQIKVADGKYSPPGFLNLTLAQQPFQVTLAQANGPTPDALLTEVMARTKVLAKNVDDAILPQLYASATLSVSTTNSDVDLLKKLIAARAHVEDGGYRAPSCLIANTEGLTNLSQLVSGSSILDGLLTAANVNALHRTTHLEGADTDTRIVVLGRRRRIPQGSAPDASPGEEPVDVAVSLPPSLEIDGETGGGQIQLTARIRYALRITDDLGLAGIYH